MRSVHPNKSKESRRELILRIEAIELSTHKAPALMNKSEWRACSSKLHESYLYNERSLLLRLIFIYLFIYYANNLLYIFDV